jgi:hypothetical protein
VFRWITGMAIGAALLVLAVGCGGGDDSTTQVTKAEFTKQADSICAEGKQERKAAAEGYEKEVQAKSNGRPPSSELQQELANKTIDETYVPSLEKQLGQMEELSKPAADEAKISKMLKALSKGTGEVDKGGVKALLRGGALLTFQEEAKRYGLSCTVF